MKKICTLCILGALICSCKTTFNSQKMVDSVLKSHKKITGSQYYDDLVLYHNKAAYTGNRSTFLGHFKQVLVEQPTDTTEMHLVGLKITRKLQPFGKNTFRDGETIGVYVQQTEGVDVGKWKLVYEYEASSAEVTLETTPVIPIRF